MLPAAAEVSRMKKTIPELLDPTKAAILVVDVQNDFCHPAGAAGKAGTDTSAAMAMIPRLQALLDAAREVGTKVIFIQTIHTAETDSEAWLGRHDVPRPVCRQGTWGAEFTIVAPEANEPVVNKHRYSAFINTRLDTVLRTYKIETIITTGVASNVCVESTARHGFMLDYHLVFVGDCSAAYNPAWHDATLDNMRRNFGVVLNHHEIIAHWLGPKVAAKV
jgi:ureidoacrylate peracid hydrolase